MCYDSNSMDFTVGYNFVYTRANGASGNMKLKNALLLFTAALIWGSAFVAQSAGMEYVGPFTFNGIRSLIGSCFLFLFLCIRRMISRRKGNGTAGAQSGDGGISGKGNQKTLWLGGLACGIVLTAASSLQQIGIMYTTVGKAGFITALYIVFVPILQLFFKKKCGAAVWTSIGIAAAGLYLLCMKESFILQKGDFLVLLCGIVFAVHILAIDYFSPKVDSVKLSCIQFLVCGVICTAIMLVTERVDFHALFRAAPPILYAGVFSCGIAYTLQIAGQKNANPAIASLILCLESVVSAAAGFLILGQAMTGREIAGCLLMFIAVILAQMASVHN